MSPRSTVTRRESIASVISNHRHQLTPQQRLVLGWLAGEAAKTPLILSHTCSIQEIVRNTGVPRRTVERAISALKRLDLISVESGKALGGVSTYTMRF